MLLAAFVGALGQLLRQPLIVALIAVGLLVGPSVLNIVEKNDQIDLLSKMGISVLLFVVGLKLDIHEIRSLGLVAMRAGLAQIGMTFGLAFALARGLGFDAVSSLYLGGALTFSSTIVVVKLLSDRRDVDSLHGRLAVGILIVQDIVIVLAMVLLAGAGVEASGRPLAAEFGIALLKGLAFLIVVFVLMRYGVVSLLRRLAQTPELLVLAALAWGLTWAAACDALGLNKELGAFVAGVSIASTPFREAIASRLTSIRDFLLLFFFVDLGAGIHFERLSSQIWLALILSAFVLISHPLIVMTVLGAQGHRKRTGFFVGMSLSQISEFALIMVALGLSAGHITQDIVALVTLVGLITIAASTYLITKSHTIYERISKRLSMFEKKTSAVAESAANLQADVVVFGAGRFGTTIMRGLMEKGIGAVAIDFDPGAMSSCAAHGATAQYGDATDAEFIASLPLKSVKWVVNTVADRDIGASLIHALRVSGYAGKIATTAHTDADAEWLEKRGADLVLLPYRDAGEEAVEKITARM